MDILKTFCLIFILVTGGCDNQSKESNSSSQIRTFQLISMTSGSMVGENGNSTDLEWEEEYTFKDDGTFEKVRTKNAQETTAQGTYITNIVPEEGTYYDLTFKTASPLVGSCTGPDTENLLLRLDGKLQNSWMMCDGPFMVYEQE